MARMETINALQSRVHPHHGVPLRPLQDPRRLRARHRRVGRLVQQRVSPRIPLAWSAPWSSSSTTTQLSIESRDPD